jgi:hypothetical protein
MIEAVNAKKDSKNTGKFEMFEPEVLFATVEL